MVPTFVLFSLLVAVSSDSDYLSLLQLKDQLHAKTAIVDIPQTAVAVETTPEAAGPPACPSNPPPVQWPPSKFPKDTDHPVEPWTNHTCDLVVDELCYKLWRGGWDLLPSFYAKEAVCKAHGGLLATIKTAKQMQAVQLFLDAQHLPPGYGTDTWVGPEGGNCVMVGAYQKDRHSDWVVADGSKVNVSVLPGEELLLRCTCIMDKPGPWLIERFGSAMYSGLLNFGCCHRKNDPGWDGDFFLCSSPLR